MESNALSCIYFAPLQESTDFVYRRAHAHHFGGIDKYFSPYLLIQKDGGLKKSHLRDTSPENCTGYVLVPQIMAGNSADFLFLAKHLTDLGYEEINWNLGCPYPMVTGKGLGSGLLPQPAKIREILESSLPQLGCKLSVKLRAGLVSREEILQVIPVLNDFPLSEVIIHPRIAKQLYSGSPDWELFAQVAVMLKHKLVYNGDLLTIEDLNTAQERFKSINTWMIGRGMLKNPFLAAEIKGVQLPGKGERIATLERFHEEIYSSYAAMLSGQSHLITRMTKFWEYFCFLFPNPHKAFKRVKKSINVAKYEIAIQENFLQLKDED
ncbi:MAG TPA: tRNA-dihydrouridine synthase family protein [Prolixibacteraceae bacterium]